MDDNQIIELYFSRNQSAIAQTQEKYGAYCRTIAGNILKSPEDTEECINDAMLRLWDVIPPQKPVRLKLFLAKIVRNLAFDRYKQRNTDKRGGGEIAAVLDELAECVADTADVEGELQNRALRRSLSDFVGELPARERQIFIQRYFYAKSMGEIAVELGVTSNHCSVILARTRQKLRAHLEQEGFTL